MGIFEHPFAILLAVFFFQAGAEVASLDAPERRRYGAGVLAGLLGAMVLLRDDLTGLLYGCMGGFLLGFLLNAALHRFFAASAAGRSRSRPR